MTFEALVTYRAGHCALCGSTLMRGEDVQSVDMHVLAELVPSPCDAGSATVVAPVLQLYGELARCWQTVSWAGIARIRLCGRSSTHRQMANVQPLPPVDLADALFRTFLEKVGLGNVDCMACARAMLPSPFDWESYTYTATSGQSWTWDVGCARALTRDRWQSDQALICHTELSEILQKQCRVDEQHLNHIPVEKLDEPILLAPVPDGQGYAVIDGSHRATFRVRAGRDVSAVVLSPAESMLAIEDVPLAMHRIALELQRQGLLPPDR